MTKTEQTAPQAGDHAPDLTAKSTSGETITLSQFRGKKSVLLAFFPLAFTGTCTKELQCFTEDYDEFAGKDVEILPISVDSTDSLKEFKNKLGMKTELLSDFKRDISRAYGVLNAEKFYSNRAYFLIDQMGVVRWSHVETHGGLRRENAEILGHIAEL
ncbi:MAG: redoxin domain-containing protein [Gemmatimonadaceae bacterium]|nr:redoxin domain-containing protein [Gemmatimonadaceae bacterium]